MKNLILVICLVNLTIIVSAQDTIKKVNNAPEVSNLDSTYYERTFVSPEEYATFQGGDIFKFKNWVQNNVTFPAGFDKAKIAKKSGVVTVLFAVNSKGYVVDVQILRGVDPVLDHEVLRCLGRSPKWEPGKHGGEKIKQQFVIPVDFQIIDVR